LGKVCIDKQEFKKFGNQHLCDVGFLKTVITKYSEDHPVELLAIITTSATGVSGIIGSNTSMIVVKILTMIIPLESRFPDVPAITLATEILDTGDFRFM
jgi:hypothetical protein